MIGLTALAMGMLPEPRSDLPLPHWTTDANQARDGQIRAFERWMVESGYPAVNLELGGNKTGQMKVIIQAASGFGSPRTNPHGNLAGSPVASRANPADLRDQ